MTFKVEIVSKATFKKYYIKDKSILFLLSSGKIFKTWDNWVFEEPQITYWSEEFRYSTEENVFL